MFKSGQGALFSTLFLLISGELQSSRGTTTRLLGELLGEFQVIYLDLKRDFLRDFLRDITWFSRGTEKG